jgi:hypothetical protein
MKGDGMRSIRPRRASGARQLSRELRSGHLQRTLAAATALSAPALGFEIYLEHYKGSFGSKWMWTPIVLTPPLTAAAVAAIFSRRAARTVLPAVSALYCLDGLVGVVTHLQGVRKRPGGFREATYNLVMGPPLLAPGSLVMVGAFGLLAPFFGREG